MCTFVYFFHPDSRDRFHPGSRITGVPINPDSRPGLLILTAGQAFSPSHQSSVLVANRARLATFSAPQVFTRLGHTVTGLSALPAVLGDTISRRLVNSPSIPQSFTPTSRLANKYARPCRLCSKHKGIRAGPDSGYPVSGNTFTSGFRGSFPSRVQSLGDSCMRTPSILPPCTNLNSSVPAYGVTQLGLRSYPSGSFVPETPSTTFQCHFHSLGLTDQLTPPRRSDPLILAILLRRWQDPRFFLPQESLSARFRRSSHFLRTPPRRGGALSWGIPRFRVPGHIQTASSTSIVWGSSRNSCPTALGSSAPGPPGYDRYGQFDSSFEYQPIRRDPFPHLVAVDSRPSPLG